MRVLCVSAQIQPHVDWGGYLLTARELARRGHEVLWASGQEIRQVVEGAGVPFAAFAPTGWRWPPPAPMRPESGLSPDDAAVRKAARSFGQWLDPELVRPAVRALRRVVSDFAPQVILTEPFMSAAGLVAELESVPLAVVGWPAYPVAMEEVTHPAVLQARANLNGLLAEFGIGGGCFSARGAPALVSTLLHLTYWSDAWFAGVHLLPQTRHVGGRATAATAPDSRFPAPNDRPWVLVTLGTTFNDDPAFFAHAAGAAADLGCVAIVATGPMSQSQVDAVRLRLPPSAIAVERADFAATLPWCSAAIHHGGAGTTHALVTHGVPQIVVPHAGDQSRQALGVQRTGVGFGIAPRDASRATLTQALAALLPDLSPMRARAVSLRNEFASLGGVPYAADLIEGVRDRGSHSRP